MARYHNLVKLLSRRPLKVGMSPTAEPAAECGTCKRMDALGPPIGCNEPIII